MGKKDKNLPTVERLSIKFTEWIGTPQSIIVHTILFFGIFSLRYFGVATEEILLILTTAVSLEAIYLAIFIQMTVNRNTRSLEEVEADIDEIQEDVEDLEEDIDEIAEDVEEDENRDIREQKDLDRIEKSLQKVLIELEQLQKNRQN